MAHFEHKRTLIPVVRYHIFIKIMGLIGGAQTGAGAEPTDPFTLTTVLELIEREEFTFDRIRCP